MRPTCRRRPERSARPTRFAALHPDEALAVLYPVTGKDVVAGFVQAVPFFFDFDKVLRELMGPARVRPVSRKGDVAAASYAPVDSPTGSNTIAVAPSRSADGFTRLLVNSHQPWDGPFAWYEAHVRSEEGWNMTGGVFPGAPLVLHGHNPDLGWAFVVNHPDLVDVYVLETNPANPDRSGCRLSPGGRAAGECFSGLLYLDAHDRPSNLVAGLWPSFAHHQVVGPFKALPSQWAS